MDCEILRAFTLFRLVGNFDQLSIDFYLLISSELNTSQVLLVCCRLLRLSGRADGEDDVGDRMILGNFWLAMPTYFLVQNTQSVQEMEQRSALSFEHVDRP